MASRSERNIFHNILKLATGEGVGRIIGFIVAPVITRIYSPGDMGVLSVYVSLIAIISPFASLKYSLAIPLNRNMVATANIVATCLMILIASSFIMALTFGIFGKSLLTAFSMQEITNYWYLIPIGLLFTGFYDILSQYALRTKSFSALAKSSVIQKVTGSLIKIALGFLGMKPMGLLIGDLLTKTGGITVLMKNFWHDIVINIKSITRKKVCYCLIRYSDFPKYRVASQLFLAMAGNIPILFFAWQYDADTTGKIGLARTMLSIPVTFLGYSVGKAFFGEIAELGIRRGKEIFNITKSVIKKLFFLSFIPFSLIIIFGPTIFQVVFGAEWYEAGIYARLFSIFLVFQFVYSPIGEGVFNVFEKQSLVMTLETTRLLLVILTLFISYHFSFSVKETILIYSVGLAIQYVASVLCTLHTIKKYS